VNLAGLAHPNQERTPYLETLRRDGSVGGGCEADGLESGFVGVDAEERGSPVVGQGGVVGRGGDGGVCCAEVEDWAVSIREVDEWVGGGAQVTLVATETSLGVRKLRKAVPSP